MNTYDMTCPKCGATMNLNTKDERLCCPYCNHTILIELEDTPDEIREKEYAKSYGYHKGKYKAEKEYNIHRNQQKKKSSSVVKWVLLVVFFIFFVFNILPFLVVGGGLLAAYSTRPTVNPFDYVEVSFTGKDGSGELVIEELVDEEVAVDMIQFDASQKYDLSVGDKVRITASSFDYKLEEDVRIYTVEGLQEYLKELDTLSQEEIDVIHASAEKELEHRISKLKEEALFVSYKPVKMFLITDEKRANVLFDVYEFNVSTESGDITYYAPVYLETAMIQQTEPLTIDYWWGDTPGEQYKTESGLYYYGYSTMDEVRSYVTSEMESGMRLKELDL